MVGGVRLLLPLLTAAVVLFSEMASGAIETRNLRGELAVVHNQHNFQNQKVVTAKSSSANKAEALKKWEQDRDTIEAKYKRLTDNANLLPASPERTALLAKLSGDMLVEYAALGARPR